MSPLTAVANAPTFTSLRRHHNYRLWFFAQLISVCGTWVQNVAQAWLVVELTHSPVAVGALALFQFGPFMLFGLLGGVVADRLDNRIALYITQSSQGVFAAVLGVLAVTGTVNLAEVYVLAALNGSTQILDSPARQAFTIQMVGRKELPNAIALNSSLFNASRVIGPALGGLIIASVGVGLCFLINAGSFIAVLVALTLMRVEDLYPVQRARRQRMVRGIAEGLRFAWRTPSVRVVLGMMLFVSTIGINFNVLLPVLTSNTLHAGPATFGVLSACFGAGALGGALAAASLGRTSWRVLLIGGLIFTAAETALAPLHTAIGAGIVLVVCGAGFTLFSSNCNATLQLDTPDQLRGRVLSLYGYVFFGTAPIGGLLAGWLSSHSTDLAFAVCGGVSLVAVVAGSSLAVHDGIVHRPALLGHSLRLRRREDLQEPVHSQPARQ